MSSNSKMRPTTFGPIRVVNYFLREKGGVALKGGFIVPANGVEMEGYSVRLSAWFLVDKKDGSIQLEEGCMLTVDTPTGRVNYWSRGRIEVYSKHGKLLRSKRAAVDMTFSFSSLLHPQQLSAYLSS